MNGEKDETEPAADAIQNENVSDKTKDGSEKRWKKICRTQCLQMSKDCFGFVPYLLRDKLSDVLKTNLRIYKTSLEMYSQAKEQLVQFFKSIEQRTPNWISGLVKM
uniref:Uncharacterized protein n=1 Tax=Ditylenchus dipsaci TaxID=166011 RepID=A0A915DQ76_9BILA